MIVSNCANGTAPETSEPFTNVAGVPVTPAAAPPAAVTNTG